MRPRRLGLATCLAVVMVLTGSPAAAQPYAWAISQAFSLFTRLAVVNLASGEHVRSLLVPNGITLGTGLLTADGSSYLIATSLGIVRFDTATRDFTGLFGPAAAGDLSESPVRGELHLVTSDAHYVLDMASGAVISQRAVASSLRVLFSPDGLVRYEIDTTPGSLTTNVRAFAENSSGNQLWQTVVTGSALGQFGGHATATSTDLVLSAIGSSARHLVLLSAATGTERARIEMNITGIACCHGNAAVISSRLFEAAGSVDRLIALDSGTLAQTVIAERPAYTLLRESRAVVLSGDRSLAYWLWWGGIKFSISSTSSDTVELATGRIVSTHFVASQIVSDLDVEPGAPCVFDLPTTASVAAIGGVVDLPVAVAGPCDPWSARLLHSWAAIANSGPHPGAATLRLVVLPTYDSQTRSIGFRILGKDISVTQPPATPGAPEASGDIVDGRATISWTAGHGGMPTGFLVRGGLRGGAVVALATLPADARAWTSDPLMPGSYIVEVAALNYGGPGPASNPVELSHQVTTPPDPPSGLTSSTLDDVVSLTWSSAPTGPAPRGYVIEAAPLGSTTFIAVRQVASPHVTATRVPSGSWQVRVRAFTDGGTSGPSNVVSVVAAACTAAPGAPGALQVMPVNRRVTLRWDAPLSGGVEQYIIEGGITPASGAVASFAIDGASRVFEATLASGVYSARVRARNACGESAPSNEVIAYVP